MKFRIIFCLLVSTGALTLNARSSGDSLKYIRVIKISGNYGYTFFRSTNDVARITGYGAPIGFFSPSIVWGKENGRWNELQWSSLILNRKESWQKSNSDGTLTTTFQTGLQYLRSAHPQTLINRFPVFLCYGPSVQGGRFNYEVQDFEEKNESINYFSTGLTVGLRASWVGEKGFYFDLGLFSSLQYNLYFINNPSSGNKATQFGLGPFNLIPQVSFGHKI